MSVAQRIARRALGPLYPRLERLAGFLKWAVPALGSLLAPTQPSDRRLLVVYDLSSQPFSIGDILIMQEASLAVREKHGVNLIDFALVYDPSRPTPPDPAFANINEGNVLFHLASVLPVAQANQHLGSLFVFNSHRRLERFIADGADLYEVWPSGGHIASGHYLDYEIFNDVLYDHYQARGSIPRLTCRTFLADWAREFFSKNAARQVPVTVNLRNNPSFHTHRNSRLEAWIALFRHCESRYPVKFIVICAWSEVDERFRQCSNVIAAKDHHTGIEQELALIQGAPMHMGAASGPVSMAWFNDKPYLMVNCAYGPGYFARPDMIIQEEPGIQRFWFANPLQRIAAGPETSELLIKEFETMWRAIDAAPWQREHDRPERPAEMGTWLR